jgi:hypothetical protein
LTNRFVAALRNPGRAWQYEPPSGWVASQLDPGDAWRILAYGEPNPAFGGTPPVW